MPAIRSLLKSGASSAWGPLVCVGVKAVVQVRAEQAVGWLRERFADHSQALPQAIVAANDRAWQAVELALATDGLRGRLFGRFRDGDLKAVRDAIRAFVAQAESGYDDATDPLRAEACRELSELKRAGRLALDGPTLVSLDLTRFADTAAVAGAGRAAVASVAAELEAEAPSLAKVLRLAPPGGTPLLAAAFAFFLRRQVVTNPTLAAELTHDTLQLLTDGQRAGFATPEASLDAKWGQVAEVCADGFHTIGVELKDVHDKLDRLLETRQVSTAAEATLKVSVTNEAEQKSLRDYREKLRALPPECVPAAVQSRLGDGLAAMGDFGPAHEAHAAAAAAARGLADRAAEADAAFRQFKDACELARWDDALAALLQSVALDDARFRPVPRHYEIVAVLGAGAFGVVLKCRNTIDRDDDGQPRLAAVKTFRADELDRPIAEVFAEANLLKRLIHDDIVRVQEFRYADEARGQRPFLAMDYVPGETLEAYLKREGKLSVADFTTVFGRVAAALHAAHTAKRRIVHRDVKPANVMVRKTADGWDVKVIDFGLALTAGLRAESRALHPSRRSTRDLATAGTLKYAAPEQLGEAAYPVGPHSDVYAFGKTALEALLGTTSPTPRHWKQLPDTLADLLGRCIDEDYDAANPAEGRFHDFKPVLAGLRPPVVTPAPPPVVPPAVVPEEFIKLDIVVPKPTPPTLPGRRTTGDKHEVTLPGNVKLPMAWCPPGQFRRRNDSGDSQEKPTHVVTLTKGYWMGVTPVTQAQWRAVMGSDPSHFKGPNRPAEQVSWDDATTFNAKLTRLVGRVMRLPTDAEWEYACRAGTTTEYHTGDGEAALKLAGWYVGNSGDQTHEIGQLAPNAWGLHDCHGNVWEWCVDWFPDATYHRGYCTDPTGPDGGSARLLRGGSWPESATRCRSAYLVSVEPATQGRGLGFRVAASSVGTEQ